MLVNDIISLIHASVTLIRLIDDTCGFYKECRDLKGRCEVVKNILDVNKEVITDVNAVSNLNIVLDEVTKYLGNRKTGWLYRNPFVEKVFFLRIDKFQRRLDSSIIDLNISIDRGRGPVLPSVKIEPAAFNTTRGIIIKLKPSIHFAQVPTCTNTILASQYNSG